MIEWNDLTRPEQLVTIVNDSFSVPQLIFKHSTRCSISAMALSRFERQWEAGAGAPIPYYLDLIEFRSISNKIAEEFKIQHQSPQVLLIVDGHCIYDTSHNDISFSSITNEINSAKHA